MVLVSLVFGYAQWRRQWLMSESAELNREGITLIDLSDHWFWPKPSSEIYVLWRQDRGGNILLGESRTSLSEARSRFAELSQRLHAIGVEQVIPALAIEKDESGKTVMMIKPLASVEELEN